MILIYNSQLLVVRGSSVECEIESNELYIRLGLLNRTIFAVRQKYL